jgi:hypothetical protein
MSGPAEEAGQAVKAGANVNAAIETEWAAFDPNRYIVDDGLLYDVDGKQVESANVESQELEDEKIHRLVVCGGENEELFEEGWTGGVYFFGSDGKFISFLRKDMVDIRVVPSPDGKWFVLFTGAVVFGDFEIYQFDGFELKGTVASLNFPFWIDSTRFALMLPDYTRKPAREGSDIEAWISVGVYDVSSGALETVRAATATENYWLSSFDKNTEEIVIEKTFVKDVKDWADWEKYEFEEIRVPVPSAG